jgi:hypothetical protein
MKKIARDIFEKIRDYLQVAIAEELKNMDTFYAQFD